MSTNQRKHRSGGRLNTRLQRKRRRTTGSSSQMSTQTEPIELEENDEVVDLTCEPSSAGVVVDLTHNDSVVFVGEGVISGTVAATGVNRGLQENRRRRRRNLRSRQHPDSCVLSSDDEGSGGEVVVTSNLSTFLRTLGDDETSNPKPAGTVICPICMDSHPEIIQSGRLTVATKCGHIFCSQCLRDALKNSSTCPTCRKKMTSKQYHPIYI